MVLLRGLPQYDEIVEQYIDNLAYDAFWDSTSEASWPYLSSGRTFVSHETPG